MEMEGRGLAGFAKVSTAGHETQERRQDQHHIQGSVSANEGKDLFDGNLRHSHDTNGKRDAGRQERPLPERRGPLIDAELRKYSRSC